MRDRRNTFGESPHAARKNIPKRKAMDHQRERYVANQTLAQAFVSASIEVLEAVEGEVTSRSRLKRLSGFKKFPDEPLGQAIKSKQAGRAARAGRRKRNRSVVL